MTKHLDTTTLDDLLKRTDTYIKEEEKRNEIIKAYQYAEEAHRGQFRKSGEPYIIHPLNVAIILTEIYADAESIETALLHDTIEDCEVTEDEIKENFGETVLKLLKGVTKLSRLHFSTENDYLIDYYKKIIVGMSEDVRVIIIKLADRLHNMRTLWALESEKQKRKAKETLEILAPIADHLGIHKMTSELRDLSLRYLKPEIFYDIAEKLNKTKVERDETVSLMLDEVSTLLKEHNIVHEIKGRAKSIYSIYNKLNKGKKFSDIYDLLALRIFVDTEQDCYLALGIIHSKFRPLPNRFKDYIAMPKPNGYQSLHTTVFGVDGYLFEIQIRTYEMDEIAENGIASHWAYKEQKDATSAMQTNTEQKLQFFKSIMELSQDQMSSEEFVQSVKEEVLDNNIYCFTPKGDVFELPKGATPLDFAYKVHTKVGETTVGAIVNGNIVPLDYELQNNDIVKINTNKNSTPSKEWMNMVKSTATKNKIKSFFTKNEKEIYIERGKYSLEKELRKKKIAYHDLINADNLKVICKELKLQDLDEIYQNIGNGKISALSVIHTIYKPEEKPKLTKVVKAQEETAIIVDGIDKVKVQLASCCMPIPGDEIVGYITKGNGISIHRTTCHNLVDLDERCVNVRWNSDAPSKKYATSIVLYTNTLDNPLVEIVSKLSPLDAQVDEVKVMHRDALVIEMQVLVRDLEHFNKVKTELLKLPYINEIERVYR